MKRGLKKMRETIIRIQKISLKNFKNVENGTIEMPDYSSEKKRNSLKANTILGIYGQNGSGKTAVIEALNIIKKLLSGKALHQQETYDCINVQKDNASIIVVLFFQAKNEKYLIEYQVTLKKSNNTKTTFVEKENITYRLFQENKWSQKRTLSFIYRKDDFLLPKSLGNTFKVPSQIESYTNYLVAKELSHEQGTSFLFHEKTIENLPKALEKYDKKFAMFLELLKYFGSCDLFVIKSSRSGIISLNQQIPLNFRMKNEGSTLSGDIAVNLFKPTVLTKESIGVFEKLIQRIRVVMKAIVPELELNTVNLGNQLLEDGTTGYLVELISEKGDKSIPLRCESEGIKKLISITGSMIEMFNKTNMCLAIDELDAGIFEYLLGELLTIFKENAKGQLIFTSHNLRPLEVLDKESIIFTTINPKNRYIRLTNIRPTNNLRDQYIRNIVVGGQKEEIYNMTNNYEIAYAFEKVGAYEQKQ